MQSRIYVRFLQVGQSTLIRMKTKNVRVLVCWLTVCLVLIYLRAQTRMLHREVACKTVDQCVSGCLYDLRIIAITYNRAGSLLRLLNSLNDAEYILDKVKLEVWMDRSVDGEVHQPTLQIANNFSFMHGHYSVEVHPKHVGILSQWISTWKPNKKSSEIAVILEDDLTVSPYFYKYLKRVHKKYDNNPKINGYALQGYKRKHTVDNRTFLEGPKGSLVFLYPIVGFWGFSPSRTNWINFVKWCSTAVHNKSIQPYVPDIIATKNFKVLQKHGKGDSMWSIWHMYYAWKHNEFTLYTNFKDQMGLTVNWQEKGLHFSKTLGATNKLLTEWKPEYDRELPRSPAYLDIKGRIIQNEH